MATREELIASAPEYIWADQVMGIWLDRDQPDRRSPLVKYRRADAALPQGEDVDGELVEQLRHAAFTEPEPIMTSEITEAMLPCPFCGGRADRPNPHHAHGGMVSCHSCGAEAFGPKWNRRALAARPAPEAGSVAVEDDGTAFDPYDLIRSQAAQIASLSAKVAEVKRERDEARLLAQTIGDQLGKDIDRLTRSLASAEARASKLQREVERLREAIRKAVNILYHNLGRQDEKVRDVEPLLRAALQQEGK